MAALNFPEALSDGQVFQADNGVIYTYQGTPPTGFWSATMGQDGQDVLDARYVEKTGDEMTGTLKFAQDPNGTANVEIKTDGSAEFAGGNAEIDSNGSYRGINSGTNNIVLNAQTGNTYFAGLSGINCPGNSNTALVLGNKDTTGAALAVIDNKSGGSNDAVISLNGDGSATFAGPLDVRGENQAGVNLWEGGNVRVRRESVSADPVFAGENNLGNVTAQINADGSATFANGVQTNGFNSSNGIATSPGVYVNNDGGVSDAINGAFISSNAAGTSTATIFSDGRATFAGNIKAGDFDTSDDNGKGVQIGGAYGGIDIQRSAGELLKGFQGKTQTISLDADGSATFAGSVFVNTPTAQDITVKGASISANGCFNSYPDNIDDINSQGSGSNSFVALAPNGVDPTKKKPTFRVANSGSTYIGNQTGSDVQNTPIVLNADGSASFAGGNLTIRADGKTDSLHSFVANRNSSAGDVFVFRGQDETSKAFFTVTRNGTFVGGTQEFNGNNANIRLNADGSATFAGNVQVGGDPNLGTASGCKMYSSGGLWTCRALGESPGLAIWKQGDNTPNCEIFANGSATFAGGRALIDATSSKALVKLENFDSLSNGQGIVLDGGGSVRAQRPSASNNADVFRGYAGDQKNVEILADGSAEFAGGVTADNITLAGPINANGGINAFGPTTAYKIYSGGVTPDTENFWIQGNGNYYFAGTGSFRNAIFNLEPDNPANYTTTTDAEGNETQVYNGPTLDVKERLSKADAALQTLKTAAAAAADFAALKSAIATALADI